MRKLFCLAVISFSSFYGLAQTRTVDVDKEDTGTGGAYFTVSGEPFVNTKFVRLVEGSPYFKEQWLQGLLLLEKNRQYQGLLKLDLFGNEIHYQDANGKDFVLTLPVQKISLTEGGTIYHFIHASLLPDKPSASTTAWFLQLYADSVALYKYFQKSMSENRPYNSATYEQKIWTKEAYRIYYRGVPVEIKKLKEAPALFGDKKSALEAFLKNQDDKKASMDDRLIAFARYLNSLVSQ